MEGPLRPLAILLVLLIIPGKKSAVSNISKKLIILNLNTSMQK